MCKGALTNRNRRTVRCIEFVAKSGAIVEIRPIYEEFTTLPYPPIFGQPFPFPILAYVYCDITNAGYIHLHSPKKW